MTEEWKCPYNCNQYFIGNNARKYLKEHIILEHLIPQKIFDIAEYIIQSNKTCYIKIEAEIKL